MARFRRDRYFWAIVFLFIIVVLFTYLLEPYIDSEISLWGEWHSLSMLFRSIILLTVIAVSAWRFGVRRGFITWLVVLLALLPHYLLEMIPANRAEILTQVVGLAGMGLIVNWLVGSYKRSSDEMRRSGEFFGTVFNSTNDAISVINVNDYTIVSANNAFLQRHGLTEQEVIGKYCYEVIRHRSESCAALDDICPLLEAVTTGEYSATEHIHYTRDSEEIYAEVAISPIKDESGNIIQVVHVSRDITQRKQAEEELIRLREAVEASGEAIFLTDLEGIITYVNPEFTRLYGHAPDEVVGKVTPRILKSGQMTAQDYESFWSTLLEKQVIKRGEFINKTKDGRLVDIEGSTSPILDGQGEIIGFLAIQRDITEHKQAEQKLASQKELTDRILASTPTPVLVVGAGLEIVLANRAFYETFEIQEGKADGEKIATLLPIEGLAEAVSDVLSKRESRLNMEFKYALEGRDKVLITQIVLTEKEEALIILRDVTAERATQEQLYHIDRLASIGELASGVAHELNNPLTGVLGYSELVLGANLSQEVKEDVQIIHDNAQRAAGIVRNLLAFARRRKLERTHVGLPEIIEHVLEMRRYELKVNNIEVVTEFADGLPCVMADPQQLEQVFLNIILNTEQAMLEAHGRGSLTVKVETEGDRIKVSFTDDGPGIPPENLRRVFDPFFTTRDPGKGTGLGLSICHGIITEHDGRIYVESQPGGGTTFFIELPVVKEEGSNIDNN